MTYDPKTNTSYVDGKIETPAIDMALHSFNFYAQIYKEGSPPPLIKKHTEILFNWLGQEIGPLTLESAEKVKGAYLAYLALGVAPSSDTQALFDMIHSQPDAKEWAKLKPPTEIMDIFDRMIASEEKIREKRQQDLEIEKQKFQKVFQQFPKKTNHRGGINERLSRLTEKQKAFWVLTAIWFCWVTIRTNADFELLGHDFQEWDSDMYLQNLAVVPLLMFVGNFLYVRYIKSGRNT